MMLSVVKLSNAYFKKRCTRKFSLSQSFLHFLASLFLKRKNIIQVTLSMMIDRCSIENSRERLFEIVPKPNIRFNNAEISPTVFMVQTLVALFRED